MLRALVLLWWFTYPTLAGDIGPFGTRELCDEILRWVMREVPTIEGFTPSGCWER